MALAGAGTVLGSGALGLASAPLVVLGSRTLIADTWHGLAHRKRIEFALVDTGLTAVSLASGAYLVGAVSSAFYLVWTRVGAFQAERAEGEEIIDEAQEEGVWLAAGGEVIAVPAGQIRPRDRIRVRDGEIVPVDGRIVGGRARADRRESGGQRTPVDLEPGQLVFASDRIIFGHVDVAVDRVADTAIEALRRVRTHTELALEPVWVRSKRLLDGSVGFTLLTASLAGLTLGAQAALAALAGNGMAIYRLTGPLGTEAGVRLSASYGVEIDDTRVFEQLALVDMVLVDRGAMLDAERLELAQVFEPEVVEEIDVLDAAIALLGGRGDAMADALGEAATLRDRGGRWLDGPARRSGGVLVGELDGTRVMVGAPDVLAARGQSDAGVVSRWGARVTRAGRSPVAVAVGGRIIGGIAFEPAVRPGLDAWVGGLRQRGIQVMAIGADPERAFGSVTRACDFDGVVSDLSPEAKTELVKAFQASGRFVGYVGAEIADRPAMLASDVAMAPQNASRHVVVAAGARIADFSVLPGTIDAARGHHRGQGKAVALAGVSTFATGVGVLGFGLTMPGVIGFQAVTFVGGLVLAGGRRPAVESTPALEPAMATGRGAV